MKKFALYVSMFFFCNLLFFNTVNAQQEIKAKKFDNPQWKQIVFIKYIAGKLNRAKEIIHNYFEKASQKAGTPGPAIITMTTGEWDLMFIWEMKDGIEELNWETKPNDIKWITALNELAGGSEKAKVILDEYSSYILNETTYIGRSEMPK